MVSVASYSCGSGNVRLSCCYTIHTSTVIDIWSSTLLAPPTNTTPDLEKCHVWGLFWSGSSWIMVGHMNMYLKICPSIHLSIRMVYFHYEMCIYICNFKWNVYFYLFVRVLVGLIFRRKFYIFVTLVFWAFCEDGLGFIREMAKYKLHTFLLGIFLVLNREGALTAF